MSRSLLRDAAALFVAHGRLIGTAETLQRLAPERRAEIARARMEAEIARHNARLLMAQLERSRFSQLLDVARGFVAAYRIARRGQMQYGSVPDRGGQQKGTETNGKESNHVSRINQARSRPQGP